MSPGTDNREWRTLRARACACLLAAAMALSAPGPALAWSNGPGGDGFGTHDWVLYQANSYAAAQGYAWVDWSVAQPATDDPDTQLHDTYHHVYDVTGSPYGDAPLEVARLYVEAVRQLEAGDRAGASRTLGLLSHYFADISVPLHTDQTPDEESMHARFERAVEALTETPDANTAWVRFDGIQHVGDVRALTTADAAAAFRDYATLVTGFISEGFADAEQTIAERALDRAANGLADIIASIQVDAGVTVVASGADTTVAVTAAATATVAAAAPRPPVSAPSPPAGRLGAQALAQAVLGAAILAAIVLLLVAARRRR